MKNILKLSLLILALVLFSCSNKYEYAAMECVALSDLDMPEESYSHSPNDISNQTINIERKIIKEGTIRFETSNAAKTKELITKKVSDFNGWISNENVRNYKDGETLYDLTIRIPSKYFDALLDSISKNVQKIDNKSISAKDVTEEFIDIEARLSTKKELENRYKELLKKANKVEEMLSIEREIGTLRSDIESIEGRYKYLKDKVDFSTLDITYYKKGDDSFGFGSKMTDAISNGGKMILWFFIAMANLWAFIALGVILVYFIMKIRQRKKKKK